ncbi:lipocalin-like domain-containing protein [uncultured Paracoccus sp.]|uniref:lipocalin-like domain-containing protein n=1 Tax=uncultured Paracoccus sp. TaxID=189685 RepID=UPI0026099348|nr:lipocalin-like domain-containing protein [uncultured Paracoccus sp.]
MSARWIIAVLLVAALPGWAQNRGFAGLGSDSSGFALADPGYRFDFPRDHGTHDAFRIEWWYLTANLRDAAGRDYGAQWTLFRSALAPDKPSDGWTSPQLWMAHAAVTTPDAHYLAERFARDGIGQAGVTAAPFDATIDDWRMRARPGSSGLEDLEITARGNDFAYELSATAEGPLVAHGENGFSTKGAAGQASHYYSQPFYNVSGRLALPEGEVEVSGQAWLDREWSSQPLDRTQTGWDWMALHLDDGRKLMAARVRGATPFVFGSLITPDGQVQTLTDDDLSLRPGSASPPVSWAVAVPAAGLDLSIEAVNPDSRMTTTVPYWEGPVRISGSDAGRGYLEMTGYGR